MAIIGYRDLIANGQDGSAHVQASKLLRGVVNTIDEGDGWVRPMRFAPEQLRALGSIAAWHPGLYRQMARATTGVCLDLETDGTEIALEVVCDDEPSGTTMALARVRELEPDRAFDGFSAIVDGRHLAVRMPQERGAVSFSLMAPGKLSGLDIVPLPGLSTTHHARIWLPAMRGCVIRDLWTNGSFVRPTEPRKQLLVLGDGFAQGIGVNDPGLSWASRLSTRLRLDLVNQGIYGQVFQPGALLGVARSTDPVRIVVCFGLAYRHEACPARRVTRDVRAYLLELSRLWPHVPTYVISPPWHDEDAAPTHPMSCVGQLSLFLAAHTAPHDQMTLVDGLSLMPHDVRLMVDGAELPDVRGSAIFCDELGRAMSKRQVRRGKGRGIRSGEGADGSVETLKLF